MKLKVSRGSIDNVSMLMDTKAIINHKRFISITNDVDEVYTEPVDGLALTKEKLNIGGKLAYFTMIEKPEGHLVGIYKILLLCYDKHYKGFRTLEIARGEMINESSSATLSAGAIDENIEGELLKLTQKHSLFIDGVSGGFNKPKYSLESIHERIEIMVAVDTCNSDCTKRIRKYLKRN